MTTIFSGSSCKFNAPVELSTRFEYLKVGSSIGREPDAIIAFLKLYVCAEFSPITRNELPSTKYASPRTISTLLPFNNPSTPPVNFLTIPAFHS
jgi:hypothetical protein